MENKFANMPDGKRLAREGGKALVRQDENNTLRYVYFDGELDPKSVVEASAAVTYASHVAVESAAAEQAVDNSPGISHANE